MTLQDIAETIDTSLTYEEMYQRETEKKPWLSDLLAETYEELLNNIKHEVDGTKCIDYEQAATITDQAILTVVMVYDKYLYELERNFENAITETPPTD